MPAILLGETGVGKDVFAEAIHKEGGRKQGPFIPLNCGGMPRDILASELFGCVEGAFSGARRSDMVGRIEAADKGTLFLDEIGEIPIDMQPYLLRVLEEGKIYPLGDNKPRRVDFRLLTATNRTFGPRLQPPGSDSTLFTVSPSECCAFRRCVTEKMIFLSWSNILSVKSPNVIAGR